MGCKKIMLGSVLATLAATPSVFAEDGAGSVVAGTIALPQGVDIEALIQSGVLVLAGIVAVALAAWGSWLIVRKCLKWVRKAF